MLDIAKRNKHDFAFQRAVRRGTEAVRGLTRDGQQPTPIVQVMRDLVFELTGDTRYKGAR